jgi:transglutaminase-like putative cysteine protease
MNRRAALRNAMTLALTPSWLTQSEAAVQDDQAPFVARRLVLSLSVSNPSGKELTDQTIWLYVPAHATATQRLVHVEATVRNRVERDAVGHSILVLSWDKVQPYFSTTATVSSQLALRPRSGVESLESAQPWLRPERFIESDHPGVQRLAAELKQQTPRESVHAIFEWVADNIRYEAYIADDLGAAFALRERRGDCTEYAYLATALARAQGLPARMVGGYVVDQDVSLAARDYHNWAEVHFDGAWQVVDPQKRVCEALGAIEQAYVAFRMYRDTATNNVGLAHRFAIKGDLSARLL